MFRLHNSQLPNNSVRIDFSYNDIDVQRSDLQRIEYKLKPVIVNKLTAIHNYLFSLLNGKYGEVLYDISVMLSDDTMCSKRVKACFEGSVPLQSIVDYYITSINPKTISKEMGCTIFIECVDLITNRSIPINIERVKSILREIEMLDALKLSDDKKIGAMQTVTTLPEAILPSVCVQRSLNSSSSLQVITPTTSFESLSSQSSQSSQQPPQLSRRVDNPLSLPITPSRPSQSARSSNFNRRSSGNPLSQRAMIPILHQVRPPEQTPSERLHLPQTVMSLSNARTALSHLEGGGEDRSSEVRTLHHASSTRLHFTRSRNNQSEVLSRADALPPGNRTNTFPGR